MVYYDKKSKVRIEIPDSYIEEQQAQAARQMERDGTNHLRQRTEQKTENKQLTYLIGFIILVSICLAIGENI